MGEQQRVAEARAALQQETAQALTQALDDKGPRLCIEDAAIAVALHLGAFVAINGADAGMRDQLFGIILGTARKACEAGLQERAKRQVTP